MTGQVKTALDSISLWVSICREDFEGMALSLWQTLLECCNVRLVLTANLESSKRIVSNAAEQTMLSVIHASNRSPSLLSSIFSYFYTTPNSVSRLVLIKCIGEAVHCWDADYITKKQEDVVRLVLTGLKDRTGDVRDASRLLLCLFYCRLLPLTSSFSHEPQLTEEQGDAQPVG